MVFLLTGCESDAEKHQRLSSEQSIKCLHKEVTKKAYEDARFGAVRSADDLKNPLTPAAESLGRELLTAHTDCDLATRDLNRFMR